MKNLLNIVYSGVESRHLEYKQSIDWNEDDSKDNITRAILGFANTKDGGAIVIGVKQAGNSFSYDGMLEEHIKTYSHDFVANYVANFADPYVDFTLEVVEDSGKKFILILVQEFEETPVFCKKDYGNELRKGALYIRMQGRPGTSEVSSASEIREVLDIAVGKGIRKFHEMVSRTSLSLSSENRMQIQKKYGDELSLMDLDDTIRKIHSKGYWRIILRPSIYQNDRISSFKDCKQKMREAVVELTGWPYPYFNENELKTIKSWVECSVIHGHFIEHWRLYRSGQFMHLMALIEDWMGFKSPPEGLFGPKTPTTKVLGIEVVTQLLTVIFEFAARLAQKEVFGDEITMTIELNDMENRHLFYWDRNRHQRATYTSLTPTINLDLVFKTEDLIASSKKLAIDCGIRIFELFNYDDPPRAVLEDIQDKLLKRQS